MFNPEYGEQPRERKFLVELKVTKNTYILCEVGPGICMNSRDCAQHITAGDFRTEGGDTPSLYLYDTKVYCDKKVQRNSNGALKLKDNRFCYGNY